VLQFWKPGLHSFSFILLPDPLFRHFNFGSSTLADHVRVEAKSRQAYEPSIIASLVLPRATINVIDKGTRRERGRERGREKERGREGERERGERERRREGEKERERGREGEREEKERGERERGREGEGERKRGKKKKWRDHKINF
jgi:hypothetical protein